MAGLLDTKTRIFDTIVTKEGRRQIASGKLKIEFVSFSDGATFYQADAVSGSDDTLSRVLLEAVSLERDQITVESDDSGQLVPYDGGIITLVNGKLTSGSLVPVDSGAFSSMAGKFMEEILDNYQSMQLIGTNDVFLDTNNFIMSTSSGTFTVSDSTPTYSDTIKEVSVTDIESFFHDQRLAHIPNFKHLPPINKGTGIPLADFPCGGQPEIQSFEEIETSLVGKDKIEVTFPETSRENNLVTQIFEQRSDALTKLDVIDFGEFTVSSDTGTTIKRVFFAGKVFEDDRGTNTFVNLITIIFDLVGT